MSNLREKVEEAIKNAPLGSGKEGEIYYRNAARDAINVVLDALVNDEVIQAATEQLQQVINREIRLDLKAEVILAAVAAALAGGGA
jgi:hypothetical protein